MLPLDENCNPEVRPGLSKGIKGAGLHQNLPFGKSLQWLKYYAFCDYDGSRLWDHDVVLGEEAATAGVLRGTSQEEEKVCS